MSRPADVITMLDSAGSPDIESAIPIALALFRTQLDHARKSRPVLEIVDPCLTPSTYQAVASDA